jgi:hypothetical protein
MYGVGAKCTFGDFVLIMSKSDGLSLMDGTHRPAVLSALQAKPNEKFASPGLEKPAIKQNV